MHTPAHQPALTTPTAGFHAVPDVLCRKCWHSLKGIPPGSVCPECGSASTSGSGASWWGNSPARLFTRAAGFALTLAVSAGLLVVLGIIMALLVGRALGMMFSGGTPTTAERVLIVALPPAIFCVMALGVVAIINCSRNLAATGLCGSRAARITSMSAIIALTAWAVTVAQDVTGVAHVPDVWLTTTFGLGGAVCLMAWSNVQRTAARGVGGLLTRALSWVQLAASVLLSLVVVVTLEMVYGVVGRAQFVWLLPLGVLAQGGLPYVVAGVLCLLVLSALLLRAGLRRFAAARAGA